MSVGEPFEHIDKRVPEIKSSTPRRVLRNVATESMFEGLQSKANHPQDADLFSHV